ncbi:MAG: hypothetical protein Q7Q71_02795 [Verrucomicrobiota bacterium JB023]|nr:hypothetical protein [Verrucomicrobiota bacterium JB023]
MNRRSKLGRRTGKKAFPGGFSLIVTVSMLVLLALLGVGLLSLSSVTLRSSRADLSQAEARSNARMAAMMAIAQLQSMTGLDTRVTASAKLMDENNVEAAGVWRSWEGSNHNNDGMPIPPNYDLKRRVGNPEEPLGGDGSGRFLGYLTSTSFMEQGNGTTVPGASTTGISGYVKMVSDGTVEDADEVYLEPTYVGSANNSRAGAISWWTTGDNSKALVNVGQFEEPNLASEWQQRLRGNRLPDPSVFGLQELDSMTPEDTYLASKGSLQLLDSTDLDGDEFYDLTTYSRGLLTNVATGGWRKDLSLFSENYNSLPRSRLRLFGVEPGEHLLYSRATSSSRPSNALLYHWADYLGSASAPAWQQTPPVCSWTALVNYMKSYEKLRSSSPSSVVMSPSAGSVTNKGTSGRYSFQEEIRMHPQVARIQWVFSLGSTRATGRDYYPGIVVTPIITLWNPYNVSLSLRDFVINFDEVFPLRLSYEIAGKAYNDIPLNRIVNNSILADFPSVVLGPGENKVYGMNNTTPVTNNGRQTMTLREGYQPNGGAIFRELDNNSMIEVSGSDTFRITNVKFSAQGLEGVGSSEGIGVRFQVNSSASNNAEIIVMSYDTNELGGESIIDQLYPPITAPLPVRVADVAGSKNIPFATATLGLRMVSPPPTDARFESIRTKGMLQANPLQHYAEVGAANDGNAINNLAGSGAYHTVNAPYDFVIQEAQHWNDSAVTVEFDRSTNQGYIVSGTTSLDGLNRCVLAEIPTRPLQSLADLQHFDVRNNNQMPPFQFNLIGNASAHPVFAPDQVAITTSGQFAGLSNDDSYLLNHVLFDDWFMSSIAPDPRDFSRQIERSAEEVFLDFLEGDEELPNWYYLAGDLAGEEEPEDLADKYVSGGVDSESGLYPFETVASLLEVDGMFNINSVSVDAWRAILKRNRDLEVPHFNASGSVTVENSEEPAFPRTTVASDVNTKGSSVTGVLHGEGALVGGYPTLTDTQIDALAEEIVEQVRERGPFLSLAEFVNRQLTQNTDRALAGTIQRALDILAESQDSSKNPFLELIQSGQEITRQPPGSTDYKFPEAALGSTNFGVPGWVRQADILRSLAPIMSARDDTFTIRAYGDSRDRSGEIIAQAWCEVVVQRTPKYVDDADSPQVIPFSDEMTSEENRRFGRRYQLLSFRWLNEDEV